MIPEKTEGAPTVNVLVLIIEMAAFAGLFTAIVFAAYRGDKKYSPAGIHNYPPDIQEAYFKTHERVEVSYKSKNVLLTKGFGIILFGSSRFLVG